MKFNYQLPDHKLYEELRAIVEREGWKPNLTFFESLEHLREAIVKVADRMFSPLAKKN